MMRRGALTWQLLPDLTLGRQGQVQARPGAVIAARAAGGPGGHSAAPAGTARAAASAMSGFTGRSVPDQSSRPRITKVTPR